MAEEEKKKKTFRDVFQALGERMKDPTVQKGLMEFSAAVTAPRQPGQTSFSAITGALNSGVKAQAAAATQAHEETLADTRSTQEGTRIGQAERGLDLEEQRVSQGQAQIALEGISQNQRQQQIDQAAQQLSMAKSEEERKAARENLEREILAAQAENLRASAESSRSMANFRTSGGAQNMRVLQQAEALMVQNQNLTEADALLQAESMLGSQRTQTREDFVADNMAKWMTERTKNAVDPISGQALPAPTDDEITRQEAIYNRFGANLPSINTAGGVTQTPPQDVQQQFTQAVAQALQGGDSTASTWRLSGKKMRTPSGQIGWQVVDGAGNHKGAITASAPAAAAPAQTPAPMFQRAQ